jgi:UDP:flavonoid glycosyltransferase YjiC (YdhE family)
MRVLFVTSASPSHFTAMVSLVWALRTAGHQVRVACQPNQVPIVLSAGLAAEPLGPDVDFASRHRDSVGDHPDKRYYRTENALGDLFMWVAEDMVDDLVALARTWRPHLVVRDPVTFAAEVAGAVAGAPVLRHTWGPDIFGTEQGRWLAGLMRERLVPVFERHSAEPPADLNQGIVDPCPESMQRRGPGVGVPIRYVPTDLAGVVPSWVLAPPTRPRVCLTWGTFSAGLPDRYLVPDVIRELADLDVELIVTIAPSDRDLVGEVPGASVRLVEGLPLHALLPSCSAVVFHGGGNTMLGAVVEGVPQVVVSQMFERELHGDRLAATGAGRHLKGAQLRPGDIRDAVREVLEEPSYREAARQLRDEARARPTPAQAVARLETIAGAQVPAGPQPA